MEHGHKTNHTAQLPSFFPKDGSETATDILIIINKRQKGYYPQGSCEERDSAGCCVNMHSKMKR